MLAKSLIERRDNIKMTIAALEERQRAQHEQAATRLNGTKKAAAGLRSATASIRISDHQKVTTTLVSPAAAGCAFSSIGAGARCRT